MVLGVLASLASYERELTRERQRAGIDSAKARGKHLGRSKALSAAQRQHAQQLAAAGTPFGRDCCAAAL
jgi:putative DNA-invertase from lambdoid prophage Rac